MNELRKWKKRVKIKEMWSKVNNLSFQISLLFAHIDAHSIHIFHESLPCDDFVIIYIFSEFRVGAVWGLSYISNFFVEKFGFFELKMTVINRINFFT